MHCVDEIHCVDEKQNTVSTRGMWHTSLVWIRLGFQNGCYRVHFVGKAIYRYAERSEKNVCEDQAMEGKGDPGRMGMCGVSER